MNWTATGHRENKLQLYNNSTQDKLIKFADTMVQLYFKSDVKNTTMYCGMQSGWDLAVGLAALKRGCKVVPCLAYANFSPYCNVNNKIFWNEIFKKIVDNYTPVVVCFGDYAPWKLNVRNQYMVDHSDFIMALWDGSGSGTKNCIDYAISKQVPYENYWDRWVNVI